MDLQLPVSSATASHDPFSQNITLELTGEYDDSWLTILGYLAAPPKTAREYAYLRLSHKKVSKVKSPQPPVSPDLHLPFLGLKDRFPTNV